MSDANRPRTAASETCPPITTLVFGAHPLIAEGLKSLINDVDQCNEALYATDAEHGVELLQTHKVDAILIDMSFEDDEGAAFLNQIRTLSLTIPVIVLSVSASDASRNRAVEMGASSYIVDSIPRDFLIQAISFAIKGHRLVLMPLHTGDESLARDDAQSSGAKGTEDDTNERLLKLTNQEMAILTFIRTGLSNKEIGLKLGISYGTVKVHVKSILRKLGAKNRTVAALMAAAVQRNPVPPTRKNPEVNASCEGSDAPDDKECAVSLEYPRCS